MSVRCRDISFKHAFTSNTVNEWWMESHFCVHNYFQWASINKRITLGMYHPPSVILNSGTWHLLKFFHENLSLLVCWLQISSLAEATTIIFRLCIHKDNYFTLFIVSFKCSPLYFCSWNGNPERRLRKEF